MLRSPCGAPAQIYGVDREGRRGPVRRHRPALRGCHTQAKSLDTLIKRTREVIELCLEDEADQSGPLELVGIQQISV
jgi:hypothetical protein